MTDATTLYICLSCGRSDLEIPLVNLRYSGDEAWICSQCLPTLIHHPHRLVDKLADADNIAPVPPDSF